MWGYAELGETKKQSLEQPDIDGFFNLYGPAPVSITDNSNTNSNTDPNNNSNNPGTGN